MNIDHSTEELKITIGKWVTNNIHLKSQESSTSTTENTDHDNFFLILYLVNGIQEADIPTSNQDPHFLLITDRCQAFLCLQP